MRRKKTVASPLMCLFLPRSKIVRLGSCPISDRNQEIINYFKKLSAMFKNKRRKLRIISQCSTLILMMIISACKKDIYGLDKTESVKDWYEKSTRVQGVIKSDGGLERKITKKIDWEKGKTMRLKNGWTVVTAPISVAFASGDIPPGSFLLIVSGSEGAYKSMIAYDKRNNHFSEILSPEELSIIYRNAEMQIESRRETQLLLEKKRKNNIELKNEPLPPVCYDYYWVETTYDIEGNIIDDDEWFLFTVCADPNQIGGGGGSIGDGNIIDIGSPSSVDLSCEMLPDTEEGGIQLKTAYLTWKYHDVYTWSAISKERGYVRKSANPTWWRLEHVDNWEEGMWAWGEMTLEGPPSFTPSSPGGTTQSMEVFYRLRYRIDFTIGVVSVQHPGWKTKHLWGYHSWNTNFNYVAPVE